MWQLNYPFLVVWMHKLPTLAISRSSYLMNTMNTSCVCLSSVPIGVQDHLTQWYPFINKRGNITSCSRQCKLQWLKKKTPDNFVVQYSHTCITRLSLQEKWQHDSFQKMPSEDIHSCWKIEKKRREYCDIFIEPPSPHRVKLTVDGWTYLFPTDTQNWLSVP